MAIITVTTTADSGAGSLRKAIADATTGDVITFDSNVFPSGATTTILLASALVISSNVVIDAGATESPRRVELDGQGAVNCLTINATGAATISGIAFTNGAGARGGAAYVVNTDANTFNNCSFANCATTTNGGGVSITAASSNTLSNCAFSNCDSVNGGGAFFSLGSVNVLTACTFTGCDASTNGGAVYTRDTAVTTLNDCTVENCTATTSGGGLYSRDSAANALNRCDLSGAAVYLAQTSTLSVDDSTFDDLYIAATAGLTIAGGVVTVATIRLNGITVTIDDGAALTITTSANTGAATFSSDGRGYLATASGVDISAATLNNVVACAYGAGLTSFAINDAGAIWTADDLTTTVLLETRDDDGDWDTLAQAAGGSYVASFGVGTVARAFDGLRFWVAEISAYWQVASFVVANNGGGGAGDSAACWVVENKTITPNISGV
jgi:parallel beta-helix repeat protein